MGRSLPVVLLAVLLGGAAPLRAQQSDRRDLKSPELIVETGGRMGTCDALLFTADGKHLLAAGDDKVVRSWPCGARSLDAAGGQTLRWPSWREQRGAIYALALSPDERQVAVAGFGLRTGTVMVLDRATGQVRHVLTDIRGNQAVIRALAFSPSGKHIAFGTEYGTVWVWDVTQDHAERLDGADERKEANRVRLVRFRDEGTLLSVAEDGRVRQWDVRRPGTAAAVLDLQVPHKLYRAVLSADGHWLAAGCQGPLVVLRSLDGKQKKDIALSGRDFVRSVALDARAERLAVGIGNDHAESGFYNEQDDRLAVYDLTGREPRPLPAPRHSYHAEALAFHPDGKRLAVAGGDNHEIRLWDLSKLERPLSEIRGAGSCLWGVALAENGRYLACWDRRKVNPPDVNHRNEGAPRLFDLERRRWASAAKVNLLGARDHAGGWSVRPERADPYVWDVLAPDGTSYRLPHDKLRYGMPRCYTFLPARDGKPVRLAVGHYWGLSIFDLTKDGPVLRRMGAGHQGEVMALAASADGKWLVSASSDQTVAAWGLDDWPTQPELGARFLLRDGKLLVDRVDLGSPAWEAGLVEGDEITLLAFAGKKVDGGPDAWLQRLRRPVPGKELYFEVRRGRQKTATLTQVRQRPLWRFFPTRDREWVLWMWQNYYYDTSTNGDSLIGWHVNNRDLDREPRFYKAEQFRKHFHRPDVIDQLLLKRQVAAALPKDAQAPPDFGLLEPPAVRIELAMKEAAGEAIPVTLIAQPRGDNPDHMPQQVDFWINDFRFQTWQAGGQPFRQEIRIPRALLRSGDNELTLQTYNRLGGRAEVSATLRNPQPAGEPRLFGVFVGVNDYSQATPAPDGKRFLGNLKSARKDAEDMQQAWLRQKGRLYPQANIFLTLDGNVSRPALLKEFKALAQRVRPDDRLVLYLSGHGDLQQQADGSTFVFCCPNYDRKRYTETGLTSQDLYEALAALPCRKVVFLDACRSGDLAINPVRSLTPGGKGPIILAACDRSQPSYEHEKFGHGVFTYALLEALDKSFARADRNSDGSLDAEEIFAFIQARVPELLKEIDKEDEQHPICFPRRPESYPLVQK
jgi:WD40 repeat protein